MLLAILLTVGFIALAYYVHIRCITALGPSKVDNTVLLHHASEGEESSKSLVEPLENPPLLVILGWGGSTRKQLRRVIEFATKQLKAPVVSYINPMLAFLDGTLDRPAMNELLSTISKEVSNKKNGVNGFVVFIHSNNGAFVYGDLKSQIMDPSSEYHHLKKELKGVIFDSSPAIFDPEGSAESETQEPTALQTLWSQIYGAFRFTFPSVAIVMQKPVYIHPFWTPAICLWAITYKLATVAGAKFFKKGDKSQGLLAPAATSRKVLRNQLKNDVPNVPHLFLYSSGDKLLSAKYVEEYIHFLKENYPQIPLVQHNFITTGHVQHFLKATPVYAETVRTFIAGL